MQKSSKLQHAGERQQQQQHAVHLEGSLHGSGVVAAAAKHEARLLILQVGRQLLDLLIQLQRAAHQVCSSRRQQKQHDERMWHQAGQPCISFQR